jgi:two-component system sensor histidine kinase BaeS
MRRRLMLAFVGLVLGVLVIAGAGSIILTDNAARTQAIHQLLTEAKSLTGTPERPKALEAVHRVLKLEDAEVLHVTVQGEILPAIPAGLTEDDLKPQNLLDGDSVSGQDGALAFAAAPVTLTLTPRQRATPRARGQYIVVLTRDVGDVGPGWGYFFLAGGGALIIAAFVAWQLSRRMSRPLIEARDATARIAAGNLQSRVPVREQDYSESTSLARSINEMAQSLEDARSRERQLLLSVSHDLRTPLTSIRGFAEAISDGAIEDTTKAAAVIIAESRRLERLVGDLLDLTKLEAHQMSISLRSADVAEVVRTTAEGFRPLAEQNGLRLAVRVGIEPPPDVILDPDRMAQILANLVENALTFARTSVTVALSDPGSPMGSRPPSITVEDDGPGIAPADLPRVFDRFYQGDHGPNRQVGSGLGLAIVAELASAMGASVRVESPVSAGGGTRFTVTMATGAIAPGTNGGPAAVSQELR